MVYGVTGHQNIPMTALAYVSDRIKERLEAVTHPACICSLAAGADQLFAELVISRGGELRVVVPCAGYEGTFADRQDEDRYRTLLKQATSVVELPFPSPSEEAYFAAGQRVVDSCDELIAVWDGLPAKGLGGTADIVAYAHGQRKPLAVIWPKGVARG